MNYKSLKAFLLCIPLLLSNLLIAQKYTISGTIKDGSNGEDLIGALIQIREDPAQGAASNAYGFYSLTLPAGTYHFSYHYLGYLNLDTLIELKANKTLNINLQTSTRTVEEVNVSAEKANKNVTQTKMSVITLDPKSIESVPVIFGEKDIVKILQLLPGVKSTGEGNSGFYVRGGGSDQNLILLDEAPVYNASHLLGFFSVFNSDALKDVTLYKGAIPAEFGGRASSVLDVKMKDGNNQKFSASGGIGLISSRLTLEGPIKKNKGSFIISARRTYADAVAHLYPDTNVRKATLYFYDINLKANYQITTKDRLFLSGYFGRDKFGFGSNFGFSWGNATATLRWNHVVNNKLFSNTSLIVSNYSYLINVGFSSNTFEIKSSIRDYNIKQDFSYFINANNTLKFGVNIIHHTFNPTRISGTTFVTNDSLKTKYALESAAYIQNEQRINKRISLEYGLRYSLFDYLGPGSAYTYDASGVKTSTTNYSSFQSIKIYGGLEPRFSGKYLLNTVSSIKVSLGRNYQYLHLLSNATTSSPTDIWVPSSNNVKPQYADQISVGYFRNFKDDMYEFSFETYYKKLYNQIDYRNGAQLFLNADIESELEYGKGKAYGAEFFIHKQKGKLTGWISYTLSRSLRQFENINNGNSYPARQDKIHDIAIVAMYTLKPKIKLAATWVFNTGAAVTFPSGKYYLNGVVLPYYTERNGYRMPNYHRLDLGITIEKKKTAKFESNWNFSVYNAYARANAYTITFEADKNDPTKTNAVRTALFRLVPSFSYNFKF